MCGACHAHAQCIVSPYGVEWCDRILPQSRHKGLSIAIWCPIVVFVWDQECCVQDSVAWHFSGSTMLVLFSLFSPG